MGSNGGTPHLKAMFDLDLERSQSEPLPVDPTIWKTGKLTEEGKPVFRFSRVLRNGKDRLRHPVTKKPLLMNGDIVGACLRWNDEWVPIPSIAAFQEWTMDSVCPTPDGEMVEPDAPNSWLSLVGLV